MNTATAVVGRVIMWSVPLAMIVVGLVGVGLGPWRSGALAGAGAAYFATLIVYALESRRPRAVKQAARPSASKSPTCPTCGGEIGGGEA